MPAQEQRNPDGTPNVSEALDVDRFQSIAKMADLAANLWSAVGLAADRGDSEILRHHGKQLRILTRSFLETVNKLGKEEPDPEARQ